MSSYLQKFSTRSTSQRDPIPGSSQVENSAGGYAWAVDDFTRLERFLVLGSEGGSYYAGERELTKDNALGVIRCLDTNPVRAIGTIVNFSHAGRIPKNDTALFALALACAHKDTDTRRAAIAAIPQVVRTGTHLFTFLGMVEQHRGWGRSLRRGVGRWYAAKTADELAYQLVKYRQRAGWSTRDPLRLAHPARTVSSGNPRLDHISPIHEALFNWATKDKYPEGVPVPDALEAYLAATNAQSESDVIKLVEKYGRSLPWEAIPDTLLKKGAWTALVHMGLPMTALMRKLPVLTRLGVLVPGGTETRMVCDQLTKREALKRARLHPLALLNAHRVYLSGQGKGSQWTPLPVVGDALEDAFYLAFEYQEPTGKTWCIGLDVSGSMDGRNGGFGNVAGMPNLTPREASAAMAMVCMKTGDPYEVVAFTSAWYYQRYGRQYSAYMQEPPEVMPGLSVVPLSARQRLKDVIGEVSGMYPGGTDASLPMVYATNAGRKFDVFSLYTDSESWAGSVHPAQALQSYREASGLNAKLICVNMVANQYSIANPDDPGMLDIVGFDTAAPQVMSQFVQGYQSERAAALTDTVE